MNKAVVLLALSLFMVGSIFAFEEEITVPAENSGGVVVDLEKGEYIVTITGGSIALFYPINPNYRWLVSVSIGTDVDGGQDQPNIGIVYFEPNPPVHTQAEAEREALVATKEKLAGTSLRFTLSDDKSVRFWISDFDYTDNSGMAKLKICSVSK